MKEKNKEKNMEFITGNTYPMSLIRRAVRITPVTMDYYRERLSKGNWESFWGHANTLEVAKTECGYDLTPKTERPAMVLDEEGFPMLYGKQYKECLVLSPEYVPGYRPTIGKEDRAEDIQAWHVLRIEWE